MRARVRAEGAKQADASLLYTAWLVIGVIVAGMGLQAILS
jgi:hypothetical protein